MGAHALTDWLSKVVPGAVVGSPLLDVLISRLDLFLVIILTLPGSGWGKKKALILSPPPSLSSEMWGFSAEK